MGVKSTVTLTREEALDKFVDLQAKVNADGIRRFADFMSDSILEEVLERMNDEAHDGEGFENYVIMD